MTFKNSITGDVMELPPPDILGCSNVLFNGAEVEQVMYSDSGGAKVTLGSGEQFSTPDEFVKFLLERLKAGHYAEAGRK